MANIINGIYQNQRVLSITLLINNKVWPIINKIQMIFRTKMEIKQMSLNKHYFLQYFSNCVANMIGLVIAKDNK